LELQLNVMIAVILDGIIDFRIESMLVFLQILGECFRLIDK